MTDRCPSCAERIKALEATIATMAEENDNLSLQNAGMQAETLQQMYQKRHYQRLANAAERKTANARDVEAILKLWRATCVPSSSRNRVSIDLEGDRAKVV